MYSLAYRMMVQVLHQLGYSGEFHADMSSQAALRGGGQAVLTVQNGNVVSCFILDKYGQKVYHNAEAISLLSSCGILEWKLVPSNTARMSAPAENTRRPIPIRLPVFEVQMRSWSDLERSVYILCDGEHSAEQIASSLSRPLSTIEPVLYKLEASGAIARR